MTYPELPPDALQAAHDVAVVEKWNMSRRSFLSRSGIIGGVVAYEAAVTLAYDNYQGGNVLRPNPEVIAVNNPYNQLFVEADRDYDPQSHNGYQTDVTTLMIPGLNCDYEDDLASALTTSYGSYSRMTRLHLGNKGVNVDDVSELAAVAAADVTSHGSKHLTNKRLLLHGHSMGGLLAIRIAAKLITEHGITPSLIALDCSPTSATDSKDDKGRQVIALVRFANRWLGYDGGPWSRGAIEAYNEYVNQHGTVKSAIHMAQRSAEPDKPAAQLVVSELLALDTSLSNHEVRVIKNLMLPLCYFMPEDERQDNTVDTRQALQTWHNLFPNQITSYTIPGGGHANPNDCRQYDSVINRVLHNQGYERYNQIYRRSFYSSGDYHLFNPRNIPG